MIRSTRLALAALMAASLALPALADTQVAPAQGATQGPAQTQAPAVIGTPQAKADVKTPAVPASKDVKSAATDKQKGKPGTVQGGQAVAGAHTAPASHSN